MNIFRKDKNRLALKVIKLVFVFAIVLIGNTPLYAQDKVPCTGVNTPPGCYDSSDSNNPDSIDTNTGIKINSGIKNPLGNGFGSDIPTFIESVLKFFLLIGIPIVTLAIIYCGFLFVTAQGNSEKLKKAKQALLYTIIGAALLLGSLVITKAIQGTVDEIKTNNK